MLRTWFAAPKFEDYQLNHAASLLNAILLTSFATTALVSVIHLLTLPSLFSFATFTHFGPSLFVFLIVLITYRLMHQRHIQSASYFFLLSMSLMSASLVIPIGGVRSPMALTLFVLIVPAGMLLNTRGVLVFFGLNVVSFTVAFWVESYGLQFVTYEEQVVEPFIVWLSYLALTIVIAALLFFTMRSISLLLERLIKDEQDLTAKNRELQAIQATLEERVAARTKELRTVAMLNSQLSQILDIDQLLLEVVNQVQHQFNYYYVHVYLLNEEDDSLVVAAGTGDVGQQMVASKHSIPLDAPTSLVARAARTITPVVVNDVATVDDWLPNKLFPNTQSELAIPLQKGNKAIGVLGIQSEHIDTFSPEDVSLIQSIADPIAIAVDNARLYSLAQQEIAQRKHVETDLRRNEARYRILFEDSPIALWEEDFSQVKRYLDALKQDNITDFRAYFTQHPDDVFECMRLVKVLNVNKACMDLYEATSKEPLIGVFDNILHSTATDLLTEELIALAEGEHVFRGELVVKTLTGNELHVLLSLFIPVEGNWSQVIVAMVDNTEHKQAENALLQLNRDLTKLNDDKDRFFSIVAHDLKGPFMPLLGNTELMAEMADILPPAELKAMSQSIHRTAQDMFKLLDDLLAWSRFQMGRMEYLPENLNLFDLVDETARVLASKAVEKNITQENQIDPALRVRADAYMLATVIRNLMSNALKFTPKGGRVIVTAEKFQQNSDLIEISVKDSGIGIKREDIEKLFKVDIQHTTEGTAKEKGTGLGLPLCRELVERHGGQIWVESELNVGSTFRFTIPVGERVTLSEPSIEVESSPQADTSTLSTRQDAQMMGVRVMNAADVIRMSETVNRSAKGVYDLLDDLRRWIREELNTIPHHPSEFVLSTVLQESVALFSEQATQKGITLRYESEEELSVFADRNTLGIVIQGLIVNALRFTPDGGQIVLFPRLIREPVGAPSLASSLPTYIDFVKVVVADVGYDLHRKAVSHQAKNRGNRAEVGLGLTLYKELVERNGGSIWVEESGKQGMIVKFTTPIQPLTTTEQEQIAVGYQQLETRLLERDMLLQTVTDTMPQTIFWKDKNSVYLGCNQKFAEFAGVDNPADIIGKTDYELPWKLEEAEFVREVDRRIVEKGEEVVNVTQMLSLADGERTWLDVTKVPLRNAAGEIIGILGTFEDVTEQKQIKEELNKQQHLFQNFIANAPLIIFSLDSEGVYTLIDGKGLKDIGGNPDDFIGQSIFEMSSDQTQMLAYVRRALAGENDIAYIFETNGLYFDVRLAPIRDEAETVIGVAGVSLDITSKYQAEQSLQQTMTLVEQSKKLLATVIDATPDWILVRDRQFRFILVNKSFAQAWGTEPQALIGKSDIELGVEIQGALLDSEEAMNKFRAEDEAVLAGEIVHNSHDVIPLGDGSVRIWDKYNLPLRDENDHIFGILTFSRDITKLRQAEQELEAHRSHLEELVHDRTNRLELLVNVSQMMNANLDFNQLMANTVHSMQDNFGYYFVQVFVVEPTTGDLVFAEGSGEAGKQLKQQGYRFKNGQGIVGTVAATKQVFMSNDVSQSKEFVPNELLLDTKSKLAAPLLRDNRVVGVLGIHSSQLDEFTEDDVSLIQSIANQLAVAIENAQLLTDRQTTIKKLQQLDQAKSQFITMISHELRTPLQAINGFAELLVFGLSGNLSEQAQQETELILNNGKHLLQLIDSIIDITQIETGEMQITLETVDVFEIVGEALADSRSLLKGKPIEMVNAVPDGLPVILADPTRLLQILFNLISNAIKFTAEGTITIGADRYEQDTEMVKFNVSDTGVGIEPEKQREIFELFQQLDMTDGRQYGGIGVGLSTCKLLVDLHGGEIGVQSEEGVGSEFWFTMPIA